MQQSNMHPLKRRSRSSFALQALTLSAEFSAIFLWSHWARIHSLTNTGSLPWYLLLIPAVLATTILHPCGHAVAAWALQMKLLSFNAGPLRWRKREGQWRFSFAAQGLFNLGGAVRAIPTNPAEPSAHDLCLFAAGPIANFLFAVLALAAVLRADWPFYDQTWRLLALTGTFSLIAAVVNLLPFRTSDGGYSDGARILQVLTRSPLNDYRRVMDSLGSTLVTPRRLRDLDIVAMEHASSHFPNQLRGLRLLCCAANAYQDSGRLAEARAALAAAESIDTNASIDLPAALHTTFVLGHAWLHRNPVAARLWWNRMISKMPGSSEHRSVDFYLAETALHWIEGHAQEAETSWQRASELAGKLPECGASDFDRSRCALLRRELDDLSQSTVATSSSRPPLTSVRIPAAKPVRTQAQPDKTSFDPLQYIRDAAKVSQAGAAVSST